MGEMIKVSGMKDGAKDGAKTVTIDGVEYAPVARLAEVDGARFVLVRTQSAGVHVGYMHKRQGQEVTLRGARRIWSWKGANTLNEIATRGVGAGSRISEAAPGQVELLQAIEVLDCTEVARVNLEGGKWTA